MASPIRSGSIAAVNVVSEVQGLLAGKPSAGEQVAAPQRSGCVDPKLPTMDVTDIFTRIAGYARHVIDRGIGRAACLDRPDHIGCVERVHIVVNDDHELGPAIGPHGGEQRVLRLVLILLCDRDDATEDIARGGNVLDRGNIMVENLFRAYFFEGQDIGNINILSEIARDTGLDSKEAKMYLESSFGIAEITSQTQLAYSKGITGVPCFIFNGKVTI